MKKVLAAAIVAVILFPCALVQAGVPVDLDKFSPQDIAGAHRRAQDWMQQKAYQKALDELQKVLAANPADAVALYESACACSMLGDKEKALDFLGKTFAAGWHDFAALEKDANLDAARGDARYKEMIGNALSLRRQQIEAGVEQMKNASARYNLPVPDYQFRDDPARNFVYIYPPRAAEQAVAADKIKRLEGIAEFEWKHLFRYKPTKPLYIILFSDEDSLKADTKKMAGGYDPSRNLLLGTRMDAWTLSYMDIIQHEFTHALNISDMWGRGVVKEPAPWFTEGLATLFEASDLRNGKLVPCHSTRLIAAQTLVVQGKDVSWPDMMTADRQSFYGASWAATYGQTRYMMHYIYDMGLLKPFIDEFTDNVLADEKETPEEAVEVVFGKPVEVVAAEWRRWVLRQTPRNVPRPGLDAELKDGHVLVTSVRAGWPAEKAGIRVGDQITAINGVPTKTVWDVKIPQLYLQPGDVMKFSVLREGKQQDVDVTIEKHVEPASIRPGDMAPDLGMSFEEKDGQINVTSVIVLSPWSLAGIKKGDVITAIDGAAMHTYLDMDKALVNRKVGDELAVEILRNGQKEAKTVVARRWADRNLNLPPRGPVCGHLGITVEQDSDAVRIREIEPGSPAEKAGLKAKSTILEYNGKKTGTVLEFFRAFRVDNKPGQKVTVKVSEDGKVREVVAELGAFTNAIADDVPAPPARQD